MVSNIGTSTRCPRPGPLAREQRGEDGADRGQADDAVGHRSHGT